MTNGEAEGRSTVRRVREGEGKRSDGGVLREGSVTRETVRWEEKGRKKGGRREGKQARKEVRARARKGGQGASVGAASDGGAAPTLEAAGRAAACTVSWEAAGRKERGRDRARG